MTSPARTAQYQSRGSSITSVQMEQHRNAYTLFLLGLAMRYFSGLILRSSFSTDKYSRYRQSRRNSKMICPQEQHHVKPRTNSILSVHREQYNIVPDGTAPDCFYVIPSQFDMVLLLWSVAWIYCTTTISVDRLSREEYDKNGYTEHHITQAGRARITQCGKRQHPALHPQHRSARQMLCHTRRH